MTSGPACSLPAAGPQEAPGGSYAAQTRGRWARERRTHSRAHFHSRRPREVRSRTSCLRCAPCVYAEHEDRRGEARTRFR